MTTLKRYLTIALLLLMLPSVAQARFRFGAKAGFGINSVKFDRSIMDADNYLGYSVGVTAELELPAVGIALDASALYSHRSNKILVQDEENRSYKRNYFEFPVHAKYKLNLLGLNRILVPFIYAGPDFAFLTSESDPSNSFKNRKMSVSLDLGGGVELINHLQVSVNYSLGMSKAFEYVGINSDVRNVTGKDRCWTISAAYFF